MNLAERFRALTQRLGATLDPGALYAALARAWAEPHRSYHATAHLVDCLERLDESPGDEPRDVVEAALWFHDAVYDPHAADNEERSAAWAREALPALGIPATTADEVARLVLVTRHDRPPADAPAALVSDVDLSILGRAPEAYDEFERRIREEYGWVPEAVFRTERGRILAGLLSREPLYRTAAFRARYERQARANLTRTVARLAQR